MASEQWVLRLLNSSKISWGVNFTRITPVELGLCCFRADLRGGGSEIQLSDVVSPFGLAPHFIHNFAVQRAVVEMAYNGGYQWVSRPATRWFGAYLVVLTGWNSCKGRSAAFCAYTSGLMTG